MAASVWSGYLTFGLISMPVRLFSGARSSGISFNMLHRPDLQRVKQQYYCPADNRVVERSESSLPEPGRSAAQVARRAVLDHFVHAIQRGIDGGQFRATNAHIAAFSIIGMCNWCAWWFDPQGPVKADGVATQIADFALRALVPDRPRRARAATVDDAMEQMREAMGVLETKLKRSR